MPREALIAIGAGLLSALASMAFLGGTPFAVGLVYMAPLPLLMAGLSFGVRAVTIGALAGFMVTGMFGGAVSAGIFGLVHALPAWMTVKLALLHQASGEDDGQVNTPAVTTWFPPGHIAAALGLFGAGFLITAAMTLTGDQGQGLSGLVATHLGGAFKAMAPAMSEDQRTAFTQMLTPLFPGAVASSWVIMAIVNAAIAQGAVVRMGRNLRPSPDYTAIDLPHWLSWPLVGAATVALAGSGEWEYMGRNVAMALAVPYFLLGLAVVHTLARRVAFTGPLLVACYMVIVVSLWATLVIAGVGIAEHWIGLRDRANQPPDETGEDGPT